MIKYGLEYSRKQYIGIYVYHDHLSFINHNRPVPPITIEDLNEKEDFDDRQYLNDELKEMFFALKLIQSYGSGIRRAKRAMEANESPKLVFGPDNDTDDYTQVIAYINTEFARIQAEEEKRIKTKKEKNDTENDTENISNDTQKFLDKYTGKKRSTAEKIIKMIAFDCHTTISAISKSVGISEITVKRYLKEFQEYDILRRDGSDTKGKWLLS